MTTEAALDPLEEQFHRPAAPADPGDGNCGQHGRRRIPDKLRIGYAGEVWVGSGGCGYPPAMTPA